MSSDEDYEVGFGKPPKHTQFKPGQSGNPNGRPRRSQNMTSLIKRGLERKIQVTENGVTRTMTAREALARRMMNGALTGKPTEVLKLLRTLEAIVPTEVEPETTEPDEFEVTFVRAYEGKKLQLTDEEADMIRRRRKSKAARPVTEIASVGEDDELDFLK